MKIVNEENRPKRRFEEICVGEVFKHMGEYYLKIKPMFLHEDIKNYLYDESITEIEQLEFEYSVVNAIGLSDGSYPEFDDGCLVEPLVTELHIVM